VTSTAGPNAVISGVFFSITALQTGQRYLMCRHRFDYHLTKLRQRVRPATQ
jgi:hypothetical protein